MAPRKKKVGTEIGIEGSLVIAAFLVDRAREWGDVKPNVFWEYGCWVVIICLLLRLFWIIPWTQKWNKAARLVIVIVVPIGWVIWNWQTARDKYQDQNRTRLTTSQQILRNARLAAERQWQPPELPKGVEVVRIECGGMNETHPISEYDGQNERGSYFGLPGGDFSSSTYIKSNRVYLKGLTPFGGHQETIQMNDGWCPKLPEGWDKNFDETGFEVVDEARLPVLQVQYKKPNVIEFKGILVGPSGSITICFSNRTQTIDALTAKKPGFTLPPIPSRNAWFKYPSPDHHGERDAK